jgi:hypothetical protein
MKELELIYANNVRIAKKLEEFGLFKEADITDNLNLFISKKIVSAGGPGVEGPLGNFDPLSLVNQVVQMGKKSDKPAAPATPAQPVNFEKVLKGIDIGLKKITGKEFNLVAKLSSPIIAKTNVLLTKFIGGAGLLWTAFNFFTEMANDPSGSYGDSPKDKWMIAHHLSSVATGVTTILTASGGSVAGGIAVAVSLIMSVITYVVAEYLVEDDTDYGRKAYLPGTLVQKAFQVEFPNSKESFAVSAASGKITIDGIKKLKKRVTQIGATEKIKTDVVQQSHSIIDKLTDAKPLDKLDLYKQMIQLGPKPNKPKKPGVFGNPEIDIPVY